MTRRSNATNFFSFNKGRKNFKKLANFLNIKIFFLSFKNSPSKTVKSGVEKGCVMKNGLSHRNQKRALKSVLRFSNLISKPIASSTAPQRGKSRNIQTTKAVMQLRHSFSISNALPCRWLSTFLSFSSFLVFPHPGYDSKLAELRVVKCIFFNLLFSLLVELRFFFDKNLHSILYKNNFFFGLDFKTIIRNISDYINVG